MKNPSRLVRGALIAVVLAAGALMVPRRAEAKVYGLYKSIDGELLCGGDCMLGQTCCEIKILPAN